MAAYLKLYLRKKKKKKKPRKYKIVDIKSILFETIMFAEDKQY
jgi:hypothetical protein